MCNESKYYPVVALTWARANLPDFCVCWSDRGACPIERPLQHHRLGAAYGPCHHHSFVIINPTGNQSDQPTNQSDQSDQSDQPTNQSDQPTTNQWHHHWDPITLTGPTAQDSSCCWPHYTLAHTRALGSCFLVLPSLLFCQVDSLQAPTKKRKTTEKKAIKQKIPSFAAKSDDDTHSARPTNPKTLLSPRFSAGLPCLNAACKITNNTHTHIHIHHTCIPH
jgi:hypothetical protein